MCQSKCPNCNERIAFSSIISNALFAVTPKPIKCEECHKDVKPDLSKSIVLVASLQLPIIPIMNTFNLTPLEIFFYATIHIIVSTLVLICFTSFSIQTSDTDQKSKL